MLANALPYPVAVLLCPGPAASYGLVWPEVGPIAFNRLGAERVVNNVATTLLEEVPMFKKILSLMAAVVLVAACETGPNDGAISGIDGAAGSQTPGSAADFAVNVGDRVFFGYDRTDLTSEGRATLDKQAEWLKKYPRASVTIEGHADERGTREYNLALGERRANAVKNYLVAAGIAKGTVHVISYGKERPQVLGANEAAWAQNRRGVTVVGE